MRPLPLQPDVTPAPRSRPAAYTFPRASRLMPPAWRAATPLPVGWIPGRSWSGRWACALRRPAHCTDPWCCCRRRPACWWRRSAAAAVSILEYDGGGRGGGQAVCTTTLQQQSAALCVGVDTHPPRSQKRAVHTRRATAAWPAPSPSRGCRRRRCPWLSCGARPAPCRPCTCPQQRREGARAPARTSTCVRLVRGARSLPVRVLHTSHPGAPPLVY